MLIRSKNHLYLAHRGGFKGSTATIEDFVCGHSDCAAPLRKCYNYHKFNVCNRMVLRHDNALWHPTGEERVYTGRAGQVMGQILGQ